MRTRIKICGITRVVDAQAAVDAGVDALGLVFRAGTPRCIDIKTAGAIAAAVPAFVSLIGVFVDPSDAELDAVICAVPVQFVQFHGNESAARCTRAPRPYIKAVRVRDEMAIETAMANYADSRGILLDTYVAGTAGGTGRAFSWGVIPKYRTQPLILAGGLTEDNVGDAIRMARPFAVDVSSGVESAPGIKDATRISRFVQSVRRQDAENAERAALTAV